MIKEIMLGDIPCTITQYDGPIAPENIYATCFKNISNYEKSYRGFVLSNEGDVLFIKSEHIPFDFKKYRHGLVSLSNNVKFMINRNLRSQIYQKNGRLLIGAHGGWDIMNQDFELIFFFDAYQKNFMVDFHDFIILEKGNFLFLTYYFRKYLLKSEKEEEVYLKEMQIQEVTPSGDVVFIWDSKDHFSFSESFVSCRFITGHGIKWNDYLYFNSLWVDSDDNILLSIRYFSQIIKIDKKTGRIIWRLGGKNGDFTFINDPLNGFSFQHCVSQLENGNILLYDNGNLHKPQKTRVVEYKLDEEKMIATLVWQYTEHFFTPATGSVQRLKNGNTFIGWGESTKLESSKRIIEITHDKKKVWELSYPSQYNVYRAYKFE